MVCFHWGRFGSKVPDGANPFHDLAARDRAGCAGDGAGRDRDPAHASRLLKLGAVEVTPEALEASLQLGARVLEALGVSDDAIARRLDEIRDRELGHISAEAGVRGQPARGD